MQELAEAGPGLSASAMAAPRPGPAHEAGFLERELDEAIRQRHGVVAAGEAVEVADVPAREALAVQAQDALHFERRRLAPRGPLAPPILESHRAAGLEPDAPPSYAARLEAEDLGGLPPGDRPTPGSHQDLLHSHGPLPGGRGLEHGHLPGPGL